MAEEPVYNLLQAIDPSKIKVPISERFCKLTLSSNKKKKIPEEAKDEELVREKRDSASRNLLKQLSQQQQEQSNNSSSSVKHMNPLLRSDSSQDHRDQRQKSHLGEYYETTMDSLNVTEDESELSSEMQQLDVESLSQKVSALSVRCRRTISLSSSCSDHLNEVTQLVSTESQRSSIGEVKKLHNIEKIPVKIYKRGIVAISSSSSSASCGQGDQRHELTDDEDVALEDDRKNQSVKQETDEDEDEDEYEEDDVITISDSSESVPAEEQTEMGVSTLRTIQEAGERTIREFREQLQLPVPTLSPEKMERVAAFLRDVSMEQRNRAGCDYSGAEDSICNHNLPPEEIKSLAKAKKMTIADTESMTPPADDEKEDTPEAIRERQRRLQALEDKEDDSEESLKDKFRRLAKAETQDNSTINDMKNLEKTPQNRERRLVSADTVENSTISDIEFDSSMSLQVTPTPRRMGGEVQMPVCAETEENTPMTQMTGLHLKSPICRKTPQTLKRSDYDTQPTELNYFSPRTKETPKYITKRNKDVRRLQIAETEENTIMADTGASNFKTYKSPSRLVSADTEANTISNDKHPSTPKIVKTPQSSKRLQKDVRRLASAETEEKTLMTDAAASYSRPPYSPKSPRRAERRLVSADTEENTMSDLQLSNSMTSISSAPRANNGRNLTLDDTEANTHLYISLTPEQKYQPGVNLSVPSSPIYKTPQKDYTHYGSNTSVHSLISCSSEEQQRNESGAPEHSITILETDDEDSGAKSLSSPKSPQSNVNNKLSSSIHDNEHNVDAESQSSSSSMTQIQMSMANINISAKINIKITIPDSTETSEDEESPSSPQCHNVNSLPENGEVDSHGKQLNSPRGRQVDRYSSHHNDEVGAHCDDEEIILDSDKSNGEDDNFVDAAAKLLTQLYGNSWQTPDVIRTLRKTNGSDDKKVRTTSKVTKRNKKDKGEAQKPSKVVEDSILGNFSMLTVSNDFCHPDARIYRDSYRTKKEDLTRILYELYNEKLFNKTLDVAINWNKKLLNTAGRCLNKKKLGVRSSVIELSEKVLTSADRLRCTLIHELCHAATWVFNGEGGHGKTWKEWAYRANATFPELPKIGVCHQYEIEYKYTYKCTLCAAKSHAHSKSKKVENIRCSYCHGAIEIFLNKKDKDGNIMATPARMATGFAKFVKDNYKNFKRDDLKHADVMRLLSSEFAALKLTKADK